MKKLFTPGTLSFAALVLAAILSQTTGAEAKNKRHEKVKKILLMIGDGTGPQQLDLLSTVDHETGGFVLSYSKFYKLTATTLSGSGFVNSLLKPNFNITFAPHS